MGNRLGVRILIATAAAALAIACAPAGSTPRPTAFPRVPPPPMAPRRPSGLAVSLNVVADALALRGVRYRLGGERPATGLDCSGLVRYVFMEQQIPLPRTAAEQFDVGFAVDPDEVRPGDLVFFSTVSPGPSHVGIVVDADTFVHAPGTGSVVRTESFTSPYWSSRIVGARRVMSGSVAERR